MADGAIRIGKVAPLIMPAGGHLHPVGPIKCRRDVACYPNFCYGLRVMEEENPVGNGLFMLVEERKRFRWLADLAEFAFHLWVHGIAIHVKAQRVASFPRN